MSLLYAVHSFGAFSQNISLKTVHHHCGNPKDAIHLELGSLVLFFQRAPTINLIAKKVNKTEREEIFFIPHAVISTRKSKNMVNRVNNEQGYPYTIHIEQVKQPMNGIRVSIRYNESNVALAQEMYASIDLQKKGILFRFINKELLDRLQKRIQPILQISYADPPRVVIDCGHGGTDIGAIGVGGVQEKKICLAIGRKVASLLRKDGVNVLLTRKDDVTLQLDDRTYIANASQADIFVSIHANSAPNPNAEGIETFCVLPTLFSQQSCSLPKKEAVLAHKFFCDKGLRSNTLANLVQHNICNAVKSLHTVSIDRKVKHAPFQVLIGSSIPAILVEVGFLSNKHEAKLLSSPEYQYKLAHAMCDAILAYFG